MQLFQRAIDIGATIKSTVSKDKIKDNLMDLADGVISTLTTLNGSLSKILENRGISAKGIADSASKRISSAKETATAWKNKAIGTIFGNKPEQDLTSDNVAADNLAKTMQFQTSGLEPPPQAESNKGSMSGILSANLPNALTNAGQPQESEEAKKLDVLIELQRAALSSQEDSLALKAAELFGSGDTSDTLEVMKKATGGKKRGIIRTSFGVVGSVSKFLFGSAFRTMYGRKREVYDEKTGMSKMKKSGGIFGALGGIMKFAIPAIFGLITSAVPLLGTIAGAIPALGLTLVSSLIGGPLSLLGGLTSALGKLGLSIITGLGRVIGTMLGFDAADILTDMGPDGKSKKGGPKTRGKTRAPRARGRFGRVGRAGGRLISGAGRLLASAGRGLGSALKIPLALAAMNGAGSVGKYAKSAWDGAKNIGGKAVDTVKNAGTSIWNAAKGAGESVSKRASSVWSGIKSFGNKTGITKVLSATGKGLNAVGRGLRVGGTWLRSPAGRSLIWKGLRVVGRGALKALGFFFTGPVGWIIGIGLLLYDAYSLYKYFTGDGSSETVMSPAVLVTQLRLMGYGLPTSQTTNYGKIFEIEEVAGRGMNREESTGKINYEMPQGEHIDDLMTTLGVTGEDPERDEVILTWFKDRFLPVYIDFMTALWNQDPTLKAGQIDKLTSSQILQVVIMHDAPADVFALRTMPFLDYQESQVTRTEYEEFKTLTKQSIKKQGGSVRDLSPAEVSSKLDSLKGNLGAAVAGKKTDFSFMSKVGTANTSKFGGGVMGVAGALAGLHNTNTDKSFMSSTTIGFGDGSTTEGIDVENLSIPEAIEKAAAMTGMPADILYTLSKMESQLFPGASADTSNAVGLFQFIPETWDAMVKKYGAKYGIPADAKRTNPLYSAILGAEYMKENYEATKDMAQDMGMEPGLAIYFGHFLGTTGVKKYLRALKANPNTPMKDVVSDRAMRANASVMAGKTVGQFYETYKARWATHLNTPVTKYAGYQDHKRRFPKLYEGIVANDRSPSGKSTAPLTQMQTQHDFPVMGVGGVLGAISQRAAQVNGTAQGALLDLASASGISGSVGGGALPTPIQSSNTYTTPMNASQDSVSWSGTDFSAKYSGKTGGVSVHPIMEGYPYYVTSLFGPRNTGIAGASLDHGGIDYGVPSRKAGTPIVSTGEGTVWRSYSSSTYGEVVYVVHPDGLQTRYAHLQSRKVREGQKVKAGEVVGLMGSTGVGSGVHLHFEVRQGHAQDSQKLDPFNFPVIADAYLGHRVVTVNGPPGNTLPNGEESPESIEGQGGEAGTTEDVPNEFAMDNSTGPGMQTLDMGFGAARALTTGALNMTPATPRGVSPTPPPEKSRVKDAAEAARLEESSKPIDVNVSVETANLESINTETNNLLRSLIAALSKMDTNMSDTLASSISNINVGANNVEATANNSKQRVGDGIRDFRNVGAGNSSMSLNTRSLA